MSKCKVCLKTNFNHPAYKTLPKGDKQQYLNKLNLRKRNLLQFVELLMWILCAFPIPSFEPFSSFATTASSREIASLSPSSKITCVKK